MRQPGRHRRAHRRQHRHDPLLRSLADHPQHRRPPRQRRVPHVERQRLGDAQPAAVQQGEQRDVARLDARRPRTPRRCPPPPPAPASGPAAAAGAGARFGVSSSRTWRVGGAVPPGEVAEEAAHRRQMPARVAAILALRRLVREPGAEIGRRSAPPARRDRARRRDAAPESRGTPRRHARTPRPSAPRHAARAASQSRKATRAPRLSRSSAWIISEPSAAAIARPRKASAPAPCGRIERRWLAGRQGEQRRRRRRGCAPARRGAPAAPPRRAAARASSTSLRKATVRPPSSRRHGRAPAAAAARPGSAVGLGAERGRIHRQQGGKVAGDALGRVLGGHQRQHRLVHPRRQARRRPAGRQHAVGPLGERRGLGPLGPHHRRHVVGQHLAMHPLGRRQHAVQLGVLGQEAGWSRRKAATAPGIRPPRAPPAGHQTRSGRRCAARSSPSRPGTWPVPSRSADGGNSARSTAGGRSRRRRRACRLDDVDRVAHAGDQDLGLAAPGSCGRSATMSAISSMPSWPISSSRPTNGLTKVAPALAASSAWAAEKQSVTLTIVPSLGQRLAGAQPVRRQRQLDRDVRRDPRAAHPPRACIASYSVAATSALTGPGTTAQISSITSRMLAARTWRSASGWWSRRPAGRGGERLDFRDVGGIDEELHVAFQAPGIARCRPDALGSGTA